MEGDNMENKRGQILKNASVIAMFADYLQQANVSVDLHEPCLSTVRDFGKFISPSPLAEATFKEIDEFNREARRIRAGVIPGSPILRLQIEKITLGVAFFKDFLRDVLRRGKQ
jgi:hypothetical protein